MRRTGVWIALLLMFPGLLLAQSRVVLNPYAEIDWDAVEVHKANLHTHTTESDGNFSPQRVVEMYAEAGYTILALTDHDTHGPDEPTWPWENYGIDVEASGMLPILGNEISNPDHIGSYFNDYGDSSQGSVPDALEEIAKRDGIAVMYHPGRYRNRRTPEWYVELYETYPHLVGMEVFNQNDRYPGDRAIYDAVLTGLMPERPVWAMANDDFHRMEHFRRSFNLFLLPEDGLNKENFRHAFVNGQFHAVYNPSRDTSQIIVPEKILVTDESIELVVDCADEQVVWISNGHQVHRGRTLPLSLNLGGYVRAWLKGAENTQTLLQPFGLEDVGDRLLTELTVGSGTGSGSYVTGARAVRIAADDPPEGMVFDAWSGDSGLIEDVDAAETVIDLLESGAVAVVAGFRPAVAYLLEVNGGQGGGEVPEEEIREIVADIPDDKAFYRWEGDVELLDNVWSPTTFLRMPDRPVLLTARFQAQPAFSDALVNGDFSDGLTGWDGKEEDVVFVENEDGSVHLALQRFSGIMQKLEALSLSAGDVVTLSFEAKVERPGTHVGFVGMQFLAEDGEEIQKKAINMDIEDWRTYALRMPVEAEGPLVPNIFVWMRSGQLHLRNFRLWVE